MFLTTQYLRISIKRTPICDGREIAAAANGDHYLVMVEPYDCLRKTSPVYADYYYRFRSIGRGLTWLEEKLRDAVQILEISERPALVNIRWKGPDITRDLGLSCIPFYSSTRTK